MVGFEGFSDTVQAQSDGLYEKMNAAGLTPEAPLPYAALDGPFGDDYDRLGQMSFLLQVSLPADAAAAFLGKLAALVETSAVVADMGCGRILAGCDELTGGIWQKIADIATPLGGHAILEAAPPEFKADYDIFGPDRSAWKLMHRIKRALDPQGVFAPGRLPGRV